MIIRSGMIKIIFFTADFFKIYAISANFKLIKTTSFIIYYISNQLNLTRNNVWTWWQPICGSVQGLSLIIKIGKKNWKGSIGATRHAPIPGSTSRRGKPDEADWHGTAPATSHRWGIWRSWAECAKTGFFLD